MKFLTSQSLYLFLSIFTINLTHAISQEITEFESHFISTLNYLLPSNTIKLIGYKSIPIPASELDFFNTHYTANLAQWQNISSTYYDVPSSLRVYFPVGGALLENEGQLIEANNLGELDISSIQGNLAVLGRYQTSHITGVQGNIISDGIIYLSSPVLPSHSLANIYIYDFGTKTILSHDHDHEKRSDGSCISNRGGENCSDRYNIHNGRCIRRHDVCVDYNGYFTDCKKGGSRVTNFPGSDCFTSLADGHCWNEVM